MIEASYIVIAQYFKCYLTLFIVATFIHNTRHALLTRFVSNVLDMLSDFGMLCYVV